MLTVLSGAATSKGRVRDVNEDSYFVGSSLFAIADGMGGHAAGDRASSIAIDYVAEVAGTGNATLPHILEAISCASDAIADEADRIASKRGMGTTLVGLSLTEFAGSPHWLAFNVGDSRLYSFAKGQLQQISVDHSEVQELVDAGDITAEQALIHPQRNVITRSMGTRPAPVVDTWLLPHEQQVCFLLCSDGLTNELSSARIAHVLAISSSPQVAAETLVSEADDAGGRDNVTVLVIRGTSDAPDRATEDDTLPRGSELRR